MFDNLTDRLSRTIKNLTGQGRLTESNIKDALRDVRVALLEADVGLDIVKTFLDSVQEKSLGTDVIDSLTPGQALIKIVRDELCTLMGDAQVPLNLKTQPPAIILLAGLQGSGKTTSAAKLAKFLMENEKKSVMLASCDIYRPAAIDQLKTLSEQIDASFFPSTQNDRPVDIALAAIQAAKQKVIDVVIIDTAGRLHIDEAMMDEIKAIQQAINPIETLFVIDSMAGQDAIQTAKAFHAALPLTGIILTKADGDSRGGAALSVRHITGCPIKFLGVGEKTDALERFYPDRMASRILGMGDVLSLIEQVHQKVDEKKAKKAAQKIQKGGFDLDDFREQLLQMKKMGGLASLVDKLPGMPSNAKEKLNDKEIIKLQAMIDSMTLQERRFPQIIKGSRKQRISKGSGTQVQDINQLLKQFLQMQKMMKKFSSKGGMKRMMQSVQSMMGGRGGFVPPQ